MILSIIFTPLIIFFNSFYIGKLFKRYKKNLDVFSYLLYGFISFFGLIFLSMIPLFLFNINFNFIFYYFISLQVLLIILYILNYKWSFITYKLNYKKILIFISFLLVVVISWILVRNFSNLNWMLNVNENNLSFINNVNTSNDLENLILFKQNDNYFRFPILTYLIIFFVYIFNISDIHQINIYITFLYFFISIILITFSFCFFANRINKLNQWINFLIISFAFSSLVWFFINYSAIIIFSFILISIHFNSRNEGYQKINIVIINLITLFAAMLDTNFILISLVINLSMLSISYFNNLKNATNYNFLILFSSLLCFFISFNNNQYLGLIFLILLILIYLMYFIFRSSMFYKILFEKTDNFLYKYIGFFVIGFVSIIFITFFILFFNKDEIVFFYEPWIINTSKINLNINNISIKQNIYIFLNILFWISLLVILIYSLTINIKKNKNHNDKFIYSFILLVVFIFYNPFFIDVLNKVNSLDIFSIKFNFFPIYWILIVSMYYKFSNNINNQDSKLIGLSNLIWIPQIALLIGLININ